MSREFKSAGVVALCFVVLASVAGYFVNETKTEMESLTKANAKLDAEIASLKKKAAKLEDLQRQLDSIEANLSQYIKILPSPKVATQERLMELVQEKAERAQFPVTTYTAKDEGGKKQSSRGRGRGRRGGGGGRAFQEIELTLNAESTFDQFVRFLNALERHESFLRVNSFSCTASGRGGEPELDDEGQPVWPLRISLNVSTFRYEAQK